MAQRKRVTEEEFNKVKALLSDGWTITDIQRELKIGNTTIQRIKVRKDYKDFLKNGAIYHFYRNATYYNNAEKEEIAQDNRRLQHKLTLLKKEMKRKEDRYKLEILKLRKELLVMERIRQ